MSSHEILFSITEDSRDGINFQILGGKKDRILEKKEDVIAVLDRLRNALVSETYPFFSDSDNIIKQVTEKLQKKEQTDEVKQARATIEAVTDIIAQQALSQLQEQLGDDIHIRIDNGEEISIVYSSGKTIKVDLTVTELLGLLNRGSNIRRIKMMVMNNVEMKNQYML
jgi:dUTPase